MFRVINYILILLFFGYFDHFGRGRSLFIINIDIFIKMLYNPIFDEKFEKDL
jgi:hypothetical protein